MNSVARSLAANGDHVSPLARFQKWIEDRLRPSPPEQQVSDPAVARLRAKRMGKTIELPITGDYVIIEHIIGIAVRPADKESVVVVSTLGKEYAVLCQTLDEAYTVRQNIARESGLLWEHGPYVS